MGASHPSVIIYQRAFQAKGTAVLSSWAWRGVGWGDSGGDRGQCWVTMGRVAGDDITVWSIFLSMRGSQWRVFSRRAGRMKAEESRTMPSCWHQRWWLLVHCNLASVPTESSEISPNCLVTLNSSIPHLPGALSGVFLPSPLFTRGNSLLFDSMESSLWFSPSHFPLRHFQYVTLPLSTQVLFRKLLYVSTKSFPWMGIFLWINISQTPSPGSRPIFTAV